MSNSLLKNSLLRSTILVGAAVYSLPAYAQAETADAVEAAPEEIVVTGSLIRNPNLEASTPVSVIGAEEIELQAANVAEELLRELPGAVPSIGSAVNNGNGGASFVNLRGLGSNRNIVLLDGVRLVPGELQGRVDLNNIPLALVQRVDVLTGGASTTYGADAVSGVVNFITRNDFAGLELNVSESITEEGDGNRLRVDLVTGANFDDGRGNATFSIGYQEVDPIYQGARQLSLDTIETFSGGAIGSGTSVPSRFSVPGGGTQQIQPSTGNLVPTFATFNFNPFNIFQTPFERFNMYGTANYEIADGITAYTRGIFSKNTVSTIIAPSGAFGIGVQIPVSNPFLPAGARATFCANNDSDPNTPGVQRLTTAQCAAAALATDPNDPNYREITTALFRRSVEAGPRTSDFETQFFDYQAGVRTDLTDTMSLDVTGSYGESEQIQTVGGYFLNSRVRQSLLTTTDASGATICQDTSNGCVPANFFGEGGTITPEAVAFLTAPSTTSTQTSLAQVRGVLSGDLGFSSPFAEEAIGFAIGGEYRSYTASQAADTLAQSGDLGGAGGATPSIDGGYNVKEAYGELIVPLVADRPFFENLQLEAGIRYSDYEVDAPGNPTFNTTTWKVGGSWEMGAGVKVRGNYARAVRAPNIAELFAPINTGLTNLGNDPCASVDNANADLPDRGPITGTLRAVCLAQGASPSNVDFIEQPIAGQANATGGGNLNAKPEKSNSYTIGVVLQPEFVPGLSVSVDYYNIKIKRALTFPTPDDAISACFGTADAQGNFSPAAGAEATAACTQIRRDPQTGGLNGDPATTPGLFLTLSNAGSLETDGIDFTANYTRDLGFAELALGLTGTYTFNSKFNAFVANPASINRECTGFMSANCGSLQPEFQFSQRTTLSFEDVDVSLLWRHLSKIVQEPLDVIASGPFFNGTIPGSVLGVGGQQENFGHIPAYNYFDLSTRVNVTENVSFTFLVQNLLDKKPPITGNNAGSTTFNSGNTFPSTYDALGRTYSVSARVRF